MSELSVDSDNYCYRHPSRQSYILCQRCGRTICPDCSTQAAVGVQCPECIKSAKANAPKGPPARVRAARALSVHSGRPVVTYAVIAIAVVVFILQWVLGPALTSSLVYYAPVTFSQPWRMVTSLFAHGSPIHLLFNMFSLFVIGRMLEPELGRLRFAALFLLSGLGGLIAVLLLQPEAPVLGASGGIFGLLGALVILVRRFGGNITQLVIVVGINLAIGFFVAGISWQAHVGGLVVGALLAAILVRTRNRRQQALQAGIFIAVGVVLLLIAAVWTVT